MGSTQPLSKAVSPMKASTEPMVTASQPDWFRVQDPSHRRSCGQMRPQISGMVEVADAMRQASRISSSADRPSQSGMLFCSGQAFWQKGTPQSVQRPAWTSMFSVVGLTMISPKVLHADGRGRLGKTARLHDEALGAGWSLVLHRRIKPKPTVSANDFLVDRPFGTVPRHDRAVGVRRKPGANEPAIWPRLFASGSRRFGRAGSFTPREGRKT
jgi:hypothetical protein